VFPRRRLYRLNVKVKTQKAHQIIPHRMHLKPVDFAVAGSPGAEIVRRRLHRDRRKMLQYPRTAQPDNPILFFAGYIQFQHFFRAPIDDVAF